VPFAPRLEAAGSAGLTKRSARARRAATAAARGDHRGLGRDRETGPESGLDKVNVDRAGLGHQIVAHQGVDPVQIKGLVVIVRLIQSQL
jgi:hypothetical protein